MRKAPQADLDSRAPLSLIRRRVSQLPKKRYKTIGQYACNGFWRRSSPWLAAVFPFLQRAGRAKTQEGQ